ncbi:hypothetical protein RhiirA1_423971 [Rhizophagus irregularis]|uniref:TERF2-interacting telomeric protein 1 Myb domain-containing protein n=1 Tax=Rhizophagus irregularis TaxID=588596 RepID=A0A2N0RG74_9GLOM|nr:hypothetical protein RhiirA1_423971 [Rhizophagus irregularis]PKK78034.1 hypothetical protein RhiirC2_730652 [Rhizophagus irregularis]CAB4375866.1 unnamed protein product [Rhizophagus irregularis]CAB4492998.1 unnamed protein product [Rhizophagus irregularis]CAB5349680.1 unnamed protein product [Rhizophagus irregularis]
MYNRENRPFVNPKAVELRSTRMSTRKRMQLSKQKVVEETELNSDVSTEHPEATTDINTDSSNKTPNRETSQHQRQQTSTLREQQQMNTPQKRQLLTTPLQQQKQDYSPQQSRSSSKSEISEQRIRKAGGRIPFSMSDENELLEFLLNQSKHLRGNKIYEQLAKQNPRHTAQSWRDHALEKYIDKPHFVKEWEKKWLPNNDSGETSTDITNKTVEADRTNKEKEVNNNKEQINVEGSLDFFDLESDDAAAEALILGQSTVQEKERVSDEEEEEELPPLEAKVNDHQNERNYSKGSENNVGIDDDYLTVHDELNESSEDCYSVSEDSGIENGLLISGKTGQALRQQDTEKEIQRQDTLDSDVGPKQKGKRVRQDSDDEDEDYEDDTTEKQWNITPISQSKEKEFLFNEQQSLMDINQLVKETRRPKEICKVALQMSTYHYDIARELLLFGLRNEIYSKIWTDEEDEQLLKYQEDVVNLNKIIDKHNIESTRERLSYLKKRKEKNI